MKEISTQSLDDLQAGIKQLLTRSRYPFSETEKQLLQQCNDELHRIKELEEGGVISLEKLNKLCELLIQLFVIYDTVKHLL